MRINLFLKCIYDLTIFKIEINILDGRNKGIIIILFAKYQYVCNKIIRHRAFASQEHY